MGRWEKQVMSAVMNMSEMVLMLGVLVGVVDDVGDREHHEILEAPPEAHPSGGALIKAVIKVLCIQWWWEHPEVVTDQHMPEEVSK